MKKAPGRGYISGNSSRPSESKGALAPGQRTVGPPTPGRLMPLKEAAAELGVSVWSLRHWIWQGKISCVRFCRGGKQFIDKRDIEQFIDDHKERF